MKVLKLSKAAKILGMTKKELIKLMVKYEFITKSLVPINKDGYVGELRVEFENHSVTSLVITTEGMIKLIEITYKDLEGELYNED